jgi:polysaccharide biosynthesis/export protein
VRRYAAGINTMTPLVIRPASVVAVVVGLWAPAAARQVAHSQEPSKNNGSPIVSVSPTADYVIGPDDVLSIAFWRDKELSADVVVRPDGKISLPLLKDVQAAGYTPEQLTAALVKTASKYIAQPNATVIVKEIRSRKVFIIGEVLRPGAFPLTGDMTVLQLISLAGGIQEWAKTNKIVIVRKEEERERRLNFNYREVLKGQRTEQNILLKPGDTVIVP